MKSENMTPNEVASATPLLSRRRGEVYGGGEEHSNSGSATAILVLSTLVAVSGSYVFGSVYSLFGSISTIGAMIGAAVSGEVADFLGRRGAMGFGELFNVIGWIAIAFAKNVWWLYIGRLSTGFGIGLLSYVVPVYIAEITPKNLRGAFTAANQLMICCGASVMYLVGNIISWRLLALIGAIPCVIQLLGLFLIPESPRFLAKIGQWERTEASLVRLRGKNADIFEEAEEIRDYTRTLEQLKDSRMIGLFQKKYAYTLIVGVGLMVLQQFGGVNAIAYYASAIFSSAGFSYRVGTTAMVIVQVPMTLLGTLLMDKSGQRLLLLVSAAGTCLGCSVIGLSFLLQDYTHWEFCPFLVFGGVLIFTGSFSLGLGGIPWVIMSEIFPLNVKGVAGSLVTLINWLCSWVVTYSFNFLAQWSSAGTFLVFAIVSGITVVFVRRMVPETKGRTLEEIQASMVVLLGEPC